jgi:spermidine synthase
MTAPAMPSCASGTLGSGRGRIAAREELPMQLRHHILLPLAFALCLCSATAADEKLILERKSPYNTILVTEEEDGLRVMRFSPGGARQSIVKPGDPDHLEAPYARAFPVAFAFATKPRGMLVVGLGGGTIPSFLHRRLPDLAIDVVELDPVVVEVAKSHFGFSEDATLRAHVGDGRRFVETSAAGKYDLILLDAFGSEEVPYSLVTREFLRSVRRALAPRGVVVGNVWGREDNRLYDDIVRTYRAVFDTIYIVDIAGAPNKLVIAFPWKPTLTREEIVGRACVLSGELRLRDDLGPIVERGLRLPGPDGARGRVLTDAAAPR